jgi:hypothetical protein
MPGPGKETDTIGSSNDSMSEIATYRTADQINEHTTSTFISVNDTITLLETRKRHHMHQFYKRARPSPDGFYPSHCTEAARADKAFKKALLLAGMVLRAEYDGASYLRYFQPDQELEVKTIFVRFFDSPDEETKEAAWAGSSRFTEAQSFYDDLPGYTECHDNENLSGYLVQDRPELVAEPVAC